MRGRHTSFVFTLVALVFSPFGRPSSPLREAESAVPSRGPYPGHGDHPVQRDGPCLHLCCAVDVCQEIGLCPQGGRATVDDRDCCRRHDGSHDSRLLGDLARAISTAKIIMVSSVPVPISVSVSVSISIAITISSLMVELVRKSRSKAYHTSRVVSHIYRAARASTLITRTIASFSVAPVVIFAPSSGIATCRRW